MNIIITCNQTDCHHNRGEVCHHPTPHITKQGDVNNKHMCLSKDKRVDDKSRHYVVPEGKQLCCCCIAFKECEQASSQVTECVKFMPK
jgi:hypothetical protein